MKLLFLDFDGVLNSDRWFEPFELADYTPKTEEHFDPAAIERLNQIVDATGCDIVISSSWRNGHSRNSLRELLESRGFRHPLKIVGMTPWLGGPRGMEIQRWIDQHEQPESMCILDDFEDMLHLDKYLVRTTNAEGLLDSHVGRVVAILNGTVTRMVEEPTYVLIARVTEPTK